MASTEEDPKGQVVGGAPVTEKPKAEPRPAPKKPVLPDPEPSGESDLDDDVADWLASIDHLNAKHWTKDGRPAVEPFVAAYKRQLTQTKFNRMNDVQRKLVYEVNHGVGDLSPRRNVLLFEKVDDAAKLVTDTFRQIETMTPAQKQLLEAAAAWQAEREYREHV